MIPIVKEEFESNLEQVVFSIDEQQAGLIISLLRNNIYKNPLLSSIREVFSNCLDEHTKFNINKPIDITLPSVFNSNLVFRDKANGISKDFMLNQYTKVGLSTKSNSNEQLGGMGLGRMSPLAYADLFTVVSITREEGANIRREYVVSKDNEKVFCSFLYEELTSDETGLTVSYTINKDDFNLVEDYVNDTIKYISHCHINVNGEPHNPAKFDFEYKSFKSVKTSSYKNCLIGLIGGIPNELNIYSFSDYISKDSKEYFNTIRSGKNIVFDIPIGSVDQSADKSIQLSTRTKKQLGLIISQLVSDHKEFVTNQLLQFDCIKDVSLFLYNNNLNNLPFTWKGKMLPRSSCWLNSAITFKSSKTGYSRQERSNSNYFNFNHTFYFDDLSYDISTKQLKTKFDKLYELVIVRNIDNTFYNLPTLSSLFPSSLPPKKVRKVNTNSANKKCYRLSRIDGLGRELNVDLSATYIFFSMDFYNNFIRSTSTFRAHLFEYFNSDLYIIIDTDYVKDKWICGHSKLKKDLVDIDSNYVFYTRKGGNNPTFNSPSVLSTFMINNPDHIITKYLNEAVKFNVYCCGTHRHFIQNLISSNIIDLSPTTFNLEDLIQDIYKLYPLFNQYIKSEYLERYINLEDNNRRFNNV